MGEKLKAALNYIESNLDKSLSIESISTQVGMSQSHLHRKFKAELGLSLYELIILLRLKRAAYQLAYRQTKVIDIAFEAHYKSHQAFTRAFQKVFKQAPSAFRKRANWFFWQQKYDPFLALRKINMNDNTCFNVELIEFHTLSIAYLTHKGHPNQLHRSIQTFIDWRRARALPPHKSRTFNLLYHDPKRVEPEDYRFDIACEFKASALSKLDRDANIAMLDIPQGRYAKIRYQGDDDQLDQAIYYLFNLWLEQSGEKLRDFPLFIERVSFFPDVAANKAISDIYLALESP
ncbi:transcriptional regulator, AraC family protein [Marinomonas sp. MED121]|uniref:AraC family transcriptional regulator n=1 Tax=Marinomonas sp. MED121 TaxID=314277 RepID=UPI000068FF87|nr:GyrI-like domain-containing protein [Marinomonas sp. MED121]EAQ66691.1 transcriptional regulator, AraC family protein [Marinomonas sp. MED121]